MSDALRLVSRLCDALRQERIGYCHWKSNDSLDRSARGENDLDLLIHRADADRFREILAQLGFKQAEAPADKWIPGVTDYYGHDSGGSKLVHVHAHHQLAVGHDFTKNYRLPIEDPFLRSSSPNGLFTVPSPNFEYVVFVLRMVLKHLTWDSILIRNGDLSESERRELDVLEDRIEKEAVGDLLRQHLAPVDPEMFWRCAEALQPNVSVWRRIRVGRTLQAVLESTTRRSRAKDVYLKVMRRIKWSVRRRALGRVPKRRLMTGGAIIAVVGGDGSGKTTVVNELHDWLSRDFEVARIHLGRPSWSWTTRCVRGILAMGRIARLYPHVNHSFLYTGLDTRKFRGRYPWILRELCKARDRYKTYRKALRFASNGGVVISDRYPLPEIRLMDGPVIGRFLTQKAPSRLERRLIQREQGYYAQIAPPQVLVVLRVHPAVAVDRKTDEDPIETQIRANEIWETDWSRTDAHIVDGHQTPSEVVSAIKSLVWSKL